MSFIDIIEWKAVFYGSIWTAIYFLYRYKKPKAEQEEQPHALSTNTKLLIDRLHELKEQHTNISQFLFDYEQEKQAAYTVSYTDGTGQKKTAEIIKASDNNNYLKLSAEQQQQKIERQIEQIIEELSNTEKCLKYITQTSLKECQTSRKGETGGAAESGLKLSAQWIKKAIGESKKAMKRKWKK